MHILIKVAPGELIDKLTILNIKLEKIKDKEKLTNISHEFDILSEGLIHLKSSMDQNKILEIDSLEKDLKEVNNKIWQIEDDIRNCERQKDFNEQFVELARSVYLNNDKRCAIKRKINEICDSQIIEEKSYTSYE